MEYMDRQCNLLVDFKHDISLMNQLINKCWVFRVKAQVFFCVSLFFWNNFFHPPLSGWEEVLHQLYPTG